MNAFSKFGSFLGTLAFLAVVGGLWHMHYEASHGPVRPPTVHELMQSTVAIETEVGICSGYVDGKTHKIVTAGHCFNFDNTTSHDAKIYFDDGHTEDWRTDFVSDGTTPDFDANDRATLVPKGTTSASGGLLACTFKPYTGEAITLLGAPLGVARSAFFGYVARPDVSGLIMMDINMWPGNSGGPVIDLANGCVIGTSEEIQLAMPGTQIPIGLPLAVPVGS